jgi:hypothetical protein
LERCRETEMGEEISIIVVAFEKLTPVVVKVF